MAFSGNLARVYDLWTSGDAPVHERLSDLALSHIDSGPRAPATVVSLGDGTGQPGLRIAARVRDREDVSVVSADYSEAMSAQARQKAADSDLPGVRFVAPVSADDVVAMQREFPDDSVDVVVMSFSLMFVPDKSTCVAEVARMLRPGGRAYIVVLKRFSMLDMLEGALKSVLGPELYDKHSKIRVAGCLALKTDDAVESLVAQNGGSQFRVESAESMPYAMPLCCDQEIQVALDMWSALMDDEGWAELEAVVGADARQAVIEELRRELQTESMQGEGHFICPEYVPHLVTAVKMA